jgi:hypothetical protein
MPILPEEEARRPRKPVLETLAVAAMACVLALFGLVVLCLWLNHIGVFDFTVGFAR